MINIPSTLKISFRALKVNKMRSALTMLGIIIGVGAVIAMLAIGTGASNRIAEQISSMGSNLLIVLPGATTAGGVRMGSGTQPTLTTGDADAILREIPAVANVAPVLSGVAQVIYGHENWSTGVVGTTPDMLTVRDWPLAAGRPFTDQDVKSATKVCLLGQTVVDNLFGDMDPVGQFIRINNVPFTVIGILAPKGQSPRGQDQDDTIYVPVTTAQKKLFGTAFPGMVRIVMVKAKSTEDLGSAEKQINELLRQRHHIGPKQENDFTVRNLTEIMQAAEQSTKVMTLLLGAIASVSLLVGGIGIMNIMLVSVTERTREIGIRMAIGAKTWDIRLQFIIEALTLSLIGGVAGIIVGISGSEIISLLVGWSTIISPLSIFLAVGFSDKNYHL
jgi:putative ABC transport system permease protein